MAREGRHHDQDEFEILKPAPSSPPPTSSPTPPPPLLLSRPDRAETSHAPPKSPAEAAQRCWSCRKRVGLTGFRCRCGELFCASHRHWDTHNCSFNYKAFGKEEISKANPLVRPAKIIKI